MEVKQKHRLTRTEVASRLRQFADMIENGSVQLGDSTANIPEEVDFELELEQKTNTAEFEIELRWKP